MIGYIFSEKKKMIGYILIIRSIIFL